MQNKNIVLVALYDVDSMGVRTLHAVLRKAGFSVRSIFLKQPYGNNTMERATVAEIKRVVDLIVEHQPLYVGISVRSTFFALAQEITAEIRKRVDTYILWGRVHASIRPAQCIEEADLVCVGEGEGAVVDLAEALAVGRSPEAVSNVWFKTDGRIIKNGIRPLIQNLDEVPFPDFSGEDKYFIENDQLINPYIEMERKEYFLMSSRGCLFSCNYCCNQTLREIYKGSGKYVRRRSVDNVIAELKQAMQTFKQLQMIYFFDDVFSFNLKWLEEFSGKYKEAIGLPFFCYHHPSVTNEKIVRVLKASGVEVMAAGIQSGSERITHQYFNRPVKNSEIIKAAGILKKYKIDCSFDLILDNPLEDDRDKRETLNLLLSIPRPFELFPVTLTHFPETQLTKILFEKGMINESDIEDRKQKGYDRWSLILDLSRDEGELFWENLYFLANKKYVPKWFVRALSRAPFLRRKARVLTRILQRYGLHFDTGTVSGRLKGAAQSQIET